MQTCSQCGNPISDGSPKGVCPTCVGAFCGKLGEEELEEDMDQTLVDELPKAAALEPALDGFFIPGLVVAERYRIVSLIGRGGMGEVYRAEDLKLRQIVALKFLPSEFSADTFRREALLNEVRQGRRVSHPNVCRCHDIGEVDGRHFMSMEFIDGEHLGTLLCRIGRLPRDKAAQLARQLCAGLSAAHREGILHLDLKPANLMIDSRGNLRITDFGLARFSADGEVAGKHLSGTPPYMAPEQLLKGIADTRSDIYAVGLIIFEMFTGDKVHQSKSMPELLERHRTADADWLPQITGRLTIEISQVVEKCLRQDPDTRFQTVSEAQAMLPGGGDALAAAVAAGEILEPEAVAAAEGPGRLKKPVALALLLATLVGLIAAGYFLPQARLYGNVELTKTPEALRDVAKETLKQLGYQVDNAARSSKEAYGFAVDHGALSDAAAESQAKRDEWPWLRQHSPPLVYFWYRASPDPLFPIEGPGESHVDENDPPPATGMIGLRLDPRDGDLIRLQVQPSTFKDSATVQPAETIEGVWLKLFDKAGLVKGDFKSSEPALVSPVGADTAGAWTGTAAESNAPVHVEAGVIAGRPVFFQTGEPDLALPPPPFNWLIVGSRFMALLLCLHNFRHRRGDRKGAFRVALFVGIIFFLEAVLTVGFSVVDVPAAFILKTLDNTLGFAATAAIYYIAAEPLMRRFWPQTLIAWSRLLAGKWRDPLVGRSFLVGTAMGPLVLLLWSLSFLVPEWLGTPLLHPIERTHWRALTTATAWIQETLVSASSAINYALAMGVGIVLLAVLLRRRWLAYLVYALLAAQLAMPLFYDRFGISGLVFSATIALLIVVLVRHGLLALVVCSFVFLVGDRLPITLDFGQYYLPIGFWAMAVVFGLAVYGFMVTTESKCSQSRRWGTFD